MEFIVSRFNSIELLLFEILDDGNNAKEVFLNETSLSKSVEKYGIRSFK